MPADRCLSDSGTRSPLFSMAGRRKWRGSCFYSAFAGHCPLFYGSISLVPSVIFSSKCLPRRARPTKHTHRPYVLLNVFCRGRILVLLVLEFTPLCSPFSLCGHDVRWYHCGVEVRASASSSVWPTACHLPCCGGPERPTERGEQEEEAREKR